MPAYAILALGPRQAIGWFLAFLVSLVFMGRDRRLGARAVRPGAVPVGRDIGWVMNVAPPLGIVFVMLRYSDIRRRVAEDRADALLTNALHSLRPGRRVGRNREAQDGG